MAGDSQQANDSAKAEKTKRKVRANALEKARTALEQLSHEELEVVQKELPGMIAAAARAKATSTGSGTKGGQVGISRSDAEGHIELKMINGCGPYKYRRVFVNGRLKSVYMGKATRAEVRKYGVKQKRGKSGGGE